MNPSARPFNPPPRLIDTRLPPPGIVSATLTRGLPATLDFLGTVETQWGQERASLAADLRAHGEVLETSHWRWTWKADHPADWHTLVAVQCEGQFQGIMAVENRLRPSRLTAGAWVLYLDFIEVAPWNYRVPQDATRPAVRPARFRGVGTLLLGEVIRMSVGDPTGGRVGLHALPQAAGFYVRCGMVSLGRDPSYHDLEYFEYPEGVAARWLTSMGLTA